MPPATVRVGAVFLCAVSSGAERLEAESLANFGPSQGGDGLRWLTAGREPGQQLFGDRCDLDGRRLHPIGERRVRPADARDLPDVLPCGGLDLLTSRRWFQA